MAFLILQFAFLTTCQHPYCGIFGSVYEVTDPARADVIVYEELSETFADLIVYEETNRLYADRKGKWFFEKEPNFARYKVYFTDRESEADIRVFFTEFESFAGCNQ